MKDPVAPLDWGSMPNFAIDARRRYQHWHWQLSVLCLRQTEAYCIGPPPEYSTTQAKGQNINFVDVWKSPGMIQRDLNTNGRGA